MSMFRTTVRPVIKEIVYNAAYLSGLTGISRKKIAETLVILTYHSFSEERSRGLFHSMPIKRFERQLMFLKKHFKIMSLSDALEKKEGHAAPFQGKPAVTVTVDDGFENNYTLMLEVTRRLQVPVTVFVATDFIDNRRPPWPTQIVEILEHTVLSALEYPARLPLRNSTEKSHALKVIMGLWKGLMPDARFDRIKELARHAKVNIPWSVKPLAWNQIREMRRSLVEIGSHTVFHSILTDIPEHLAKEELIQSKARIEEALGEPCELFSYPNGDWSDDVSGLVREAGYKAAVTQDRGANRYSSNPYSLCRIEVPGNETLATFACRSSLLTADLS